MAGAKRGQVLAIDAGEVPDVRAAVDAAHAQVPRAVVLVFAEGPAEKELGAALKDSGIFAVLPTAIEPRRPQEAFTDAMAQALQAPPTPRASPAAAWERTIRAFRHRPREPDEELAGSRPRLVLIGAALAAALVAAGLWVFMSGRGGLGIPAPPPPAPAAAPAAAAAPPPAARPRRKA